LLKSIDSRGGPRSLKTAARAAIVMLAVFAFADKVIEQPQTSIFRGLRIARDERRQRGLDGRRRASEGSDAYFLRHAPARPSALSPL
jgi:hypothetical protein